MKNLIRDLMTPETDTKAEGFRLLTLAGIAFLAVVLFGGLAYAVLT